MKELTYNEMVMIKEAVQHYYEDVVSDLPNISYEEECAWDNLLQKLEEHVE